MTLMERGYREAVTRESPDRMIANLNKRVTELESQVASLVKRAVQEAKDHTTTNRIDPKIVRGVAEIIGVVSRHYGLSEGELTGEWRERVICHPRQVGMYIARETIKASHSMIARCFQRHDQSASRHAYKHVRLRMEADQDLRRDIETMIRVLTGAP